jgi:NAD(P) transhydrogenase
MKTRHYDVVVIGSGPGGEGAAMTLAKSGREVAMVERHTMVGGGCTHWGTIPSKALRQTIQRITDFREDPLFQQIAEDTDISYPQLLANAEEVITSQVRMRRRFYERNKVKVIHGQARFLEPNLLDVVGPNDRSDR